MGRVELAFFFITAAMPFCFFFHKITISQSCFVFRVNRVNATASALNGVVMVKVIVMKGIDLEFMPNLLMAAILSLPPNPCFTIFFLVAMFDFWPILWMASLQCFFPPFFSYYTAIAVWPLLPDSIN